MTQRYAWLVALLSFLMGGGVSLSSFYTFVYIPERDEKEEYQAAWQREQQRNQAAEEQAAALSISLQDTERQLVLLEERKFTSSEVLELYEFINRYREENNLARLTVQKRLEQSAFNKASHMAVFDYFDHTTPQGEGMRSFINAAGYFYTKAGENLGLGFDNPEDLFIGWRESPPHNEIMLDGDYQDIGIGYHCEDRQDSDLYDCYVVMHVGRV